MAGVWKKTLNYLGLVEEDEDFVDDMPEAEPAPVRRMRPQPFVRSPRKQRASFARSPRPARRSPPPRAIHKSEPKRFNEAREVADRFKEGTAVIMNLQSTEDAIARRLVDFATRARVRARRQDRARRQPGVPAHAGRRGGFRGGARAPRGRRFLQPVLAGVAANPNPPPSPAFRRAVSLCNR